jgi:hypothetical protein
VLLKARGIGADDGLTFGDSYSIDYGGGDLTGSDLTAAEDFNSSLPGGASSSGSNGSSSSSGFNWGGALTAVSNIFGAGSRILGGGVSSLTPSQLAMMQAQQNAARTNTLLIGGGVLLAGGLAFLALRRKSST